MGLEAVIF